jgi:hypothetical protein
VLEGLLVYGTVMDAADFARLSSEIVELGARLKELKIDRDNLQVEIDALDAQLRVKLGEHAVYLSELLGQAGVGLPAVSSGSVSSVSPVSSVVPATGISAELRQRIVDYAGSRVDETGEGVSASDIAVALHLDPALVREALREAMTAP